MNKTDIVERIASSHDLPKIEAAKYVESVIAAIRDGIREDSRVTIAGFGTFLRRQRSPRLGVNPMTKQRMNIAGSITCSFRPAPALKDELGAMVGVHS